MNIYETHTIVLGSGAAGLNAAVQLKRRGVNDLLILTEGLDKGTSINTGSDKQTYYKLGLYGGASDSPEEMAKTFFETGSTDGDTVLVESALSARAFYHLCELGVPFPQDAWGQYPGYKTDHDPRQRATSIGPYTSREMCRALIAEVQRLEIPVRENRIAVKLLKIEENGVDRIAGVFCVNTASNRDQCVDLYLCDNLVFAVGGPGGLYRDSVYPTAHIGGIGLAMEIGATCQNLSDSQFGLASTAFRWNVSGSYMQVIPRFISGDSAETAEEFLDEYFESPAKRDTAVFLKGYQWPFDAQKIRGSSLIDVAVYRETVERGRRIFLDYRSNSSQFDFDALPIDVRKYLNKSGAVDVTPLARLAKMNSPAIELYRDHEIDLAAAPLEIALCVQHNNGGLSVGRFWESVNIAHLFPAGEVAGTHGVARPGGSALNSGQVAGFRIAEFISQRYQNKTLDYDKAKELAEPMFEKIQNGGFANWRSLRMQIQNQMSDTAGAIVDVQKLRGAIDETLNEYLRFVGGAETEDGVKTETALDLAESHRTRLLILASSVYLLALQGHALVGSRGSRLVLEDSGKRIHENIPWRIAPEEKEYRKFVQETKIEFKKVPEEQPQLQFQITFRPCRPIPESDAWFETAWAAFRNEEHLEEKRES